MPSYQYRKSQCGDKNILRPSYLHTGVSYTCIMTSLCWTGDQTVAQMPEVKTKKKHLWRDKNIPGCLCPYQGCWCHGSLYRQDISSLGIAYKNIERHTADTIVSWPNPKQWVIVHTSDLMMKVYKVYIFSQSQEKWINWKHTAPHIV